MLNRRRELMKKCLHKEPYNLSELVGQDGDHDRLPPRNGSKRACSDGAARCPTTAVGGSRCPATICVRYPKYSLLKSFTLTPMGISWYGGRKWPQVCFNITELGLLLSLAK